MTSPVQTLEIHCTGCGRLYEDWHRGSVDLSLEGWDPDDPNVEAYLRECSTATCAECSVVVDLDMLIVDGATFSFR